MKIFACLVLPLSLAVVISATADAQQIHVGPNMQISPWDGQHTYDEVRIAADPGAHHVGGQVAVPGVQHAVGRRLHQEAVVHQLEPASVARTAVGRQHAGMGRPADSRTTPTVDRAAPLIGAEGGSGCR